MSRRKSSPEGLAPVHGDERLPRLQTIIATSPENPGGDPNVRPHQAGEAAGRIIGGGLGLVIAAALIILMLGPILWVPIWSGLRVARFTPEPLWAWLAGIAAFLVAALLQTWLLIQRRPVVRYPVVALFSLAWVGGLWLEFTAPRHDWITTAPTAHMPGPWSWVLIGVGTVIYAGVYLLSLSRFGTARWAKRWQLLKP